MTSMAAWPALRAFSHSRRLADAALFSANRFLDEPVRAGPGLFGTEPVVTASGDLSMSTILNIGMHSYVNPTLPIVAELVRRGHLVTYHTFSAFAAQIEAAGAKVHLYPGGAMPLPDPPIPHALLEELARTTLGLRLSVLSDLRGALTGRPVDGARWPRESSMCQ